MTREEEIKQEIDLRLAGCFGNYSEGYEEGFIEGAKWADKTMIDKACEWLENELYEVMAEPNHYYIYDVQSKSYNSLEVLINGFKKAMEE
jgi:hypothetical protein